MLFDQHKIFSHSLICWVLDTSGRASRLPALIWSRNSLQTRLAYAISYSYFSTPGKRLVRCSVQIWPVLWTNKFLLFRGRLPSSPPLIYSDDHFATCARNVSAILLLPHSSVIFRLEGTWNVFPC